MPASNAALIASTAALSDSFAPNRSPPTSAAPYPTTEISGPNAPSLRDSTIRIPPSRWSGGNGPIGHPEGVGVTLLERVVRRMDRTGWRRTVDEPALAFDRGG